MRHINFKKLILVLGIIIVLNLFINYGVATFYDAPEYEDFCPKELSAKKHNTEEECETAGGFWTEDQVLSRGKVPAVVEKNGAEINESEGWCDAQYSCRQEFEEARDFYKRNVFIILITAGIISIIIGFLIVQAEAVSLGLSFGGLISLIIGTIRYWSAMDEYLRFIILGIALIILIWIGIKKIKD